MPALGTGSGGSSSAAGLQQELSNVLLAQVLGEQHGPVGLHRVVGGLDDLDANGEVFNALPSRSWQYRPSHQRQPAGG